PTMATTLGQPAEYSTEPVMWEAYKKQREEGLTIVERLKRYWSFMPLLSVAAWRTIYISILSMMLAILVGFIIALMRVYGNWPMRTIGTLYVEIVRGTPLLIQLLIIFYGLPNIGIQLDPILAGVIGLGLNYGAYEAENYRAGLLSVPRGQTEAALALGMTRRQALRHVIAPQAVRLVLPPVTNDFISLLKDSSLVSMITIIELTGAYNQLATTYYDYFGVGLLVATIYLLIGLPFVRLARWTEAKLTVDRNNGRPLQKKRVA
ncbi:MAG: amino acid ABC transporter permease, partial [Puniceicoccales bacterium]